MTIEEDFVAYKEHCKRYPTALVLRDEIYPDILIHHCAGQDTFSIVCAWNGQFRRFIPCVRLH